MRNLKELATEALDAQNACNLSGVVHSWHRALEDLWANARAMGKGTDWVNKHPINRAYVSKLLSLSRYEIGDKTFEECEMLASGQDVAEAVQKALTGEG